MKEKITGRWYAYDDSIWVAPLWSLIVGIALGAATFLLAISVGHDLKSLTETHVLVWDSWLFFRIFCMAFFGAFAAAFTFANAVLLFRNVKVWLRKISTNNKSTYKFQH